MALKLRRPRRARQQTSYVNEGKQKPRALTAAAATIIIVTNVFGPDFIVEVVVVVVVLEFG